MYDSLVIRGCSKDVIERERNGINTLTLQRPESRNHSFESTRCITVFTKKLFPNRKVFFNLLELSEDKLYKKTAIIHEKDHGSTCQKADKINGK